MTSIDRPDAPSRIAAHSPRLRRARCLVCYWDAGHALIAHPYPYGRPTPLPPPSAAVLAAFDDWTTAAEALPDLSPLTDAVGHLHARGLLLAEGTPEAARDAELAAHWDGWAPQAPFLHYTSQDGVPPTGLIPPASGPFTTYPYARRLRLPDQPTDLTAPFGDVLYQRRTHYAFAAAPVPLATLSRLLTAVFAPTEHLGSTPQGALFRRTSPCAGARQELEAYLAIRDVAAVPPGWYHYNVAEHSLELLTEGCTGAQIIEACDDQAWTGEAAFLVVLSAVVARQLTHHPGPRSYRVCLLDAGHLGQTFTLTATALGLASFQLAAFRDSTLATRLGLDNITQTPLHLLGAGLPADAAVLTPAESEHQEPGTT
ncbi:SagB/ThcOx family dehydrogenase [Nonomuraea sp. NN258]|uniref:SagB/ThcOx family dehydrogenase n=1 Tax=Nonomuraea antri TaxID=2730852 RepID=UPI0015687C90|nr:SagB/ThcOx family dehydrogenase [Nonomuraea antri]NRQ30911.1 SagB/ThcOx family dehydrogenase [Nonomuraea antri]